MFITLATVVLAILFYYHVVKPFVYWKDRGVPQGSSLEGLCDSWKVAFRSKSSLELVRDVYNRFCGTRYTGMYQLFTPTFVVKDPDLIKLVTIKDFDHFVDRRNIVPEDIDPLWGKNLAALEGKKWRDMRTLLSPSFTGSKLKSMFVLIKECSENVVQHFLKKHQEICKVEGTDLFARLTNDIITTTSLGVKVDSLSQPDNPFYLMGKDFTDFTKIRDIVAQAMIFFLGGFDTVSSLMFFSAYELALNQDIQARLRKEIYDTLEECNGDVTFEGISKMKYMDMVVSETLRKWPIFISIDRNCTKDYLIEPKNPDEKPLYIKEGTTIMLPIYGIHHDPKCYPDPERFDPEKFSEENKDKINPYAYFSFGLGPRSCIGSRFATTETKTVLFYILSKFEIIPIEETDIPVKINNANIKLRAEKTWLGLKRIKEQKA